MSRRIANVFSIPPGVPFLEALARATHGPDHRDVVQARLARGQVALARGDYETADSLAASDPRLP